jgi:hypothetical protein
VENSSQFSDESVLGCCGVGVVVVVCCGDSSNLSGKISCSNVSRSKTAISPVLGSKWMAETSFWQHRHNLSECNGLLLKGEQIMVPISLQADVLRQIHDGQLRISKCIERAKLTVYWPRYIDQVKNLVEGCDRCQENRHQNPAQPSYPVPILEYPFQKVAADLYENGGVHYILVVDYFSKWPCAVPLKTMTSASVITKLKRFFIDFGVPEQLVSDNGKQFDSAEFRQFCNALNIRSTTSSPKYPCSNGLVVRMVQTVKESFIKSPSKGKTIT